VRTVWLSGPAGNYTKDGACGCLSTAAQGSCEAPGTYEKPDIVAVILLRIGATSSAEAAVLSISCLADAVILVPRDGLQNLPLDRNFSETLPCPVRLLDHKVTWQNSIARAINAALMAAHTAGASSVCVH
jgi:hypothetical protein